MVFVSYNSGWLQTLHPSALFYHYLYQTNIRSSIKTSFATPAGFPAGSRSCATMVAMPIIAEGTPILNTAVIQPHLLGYLIVTAASTIITASPTSTRQQTENKQNNAYHNDNRRSLVLALTVRLSYRIFIVHPAHRHSCSYWKSPVDAYFHLVSYHG